MDTLDLATYLDCMMQTNHFHRHMAVTVLRTTETVVGIGRLSSDLLKCGGVALTNAFSSLRNKSSSPKGNMHISALPVPKTSELVVLTNRVHKYILHLPV